jgi:ABC-type transport system involved in multi-copper enzyme maturation permease subunit
MFGSSIFVLGLLVTWITPVWLLSVGVALGVIVLAVAYGIVWLVSRRLADEIYTGVREGILLPIFYLAMFLTGFSVLGIVLVPEIPYRAVISAVPRIPVVGLGEIEVVVPPTVRDYEVKQFGPRRSEVRQSELQAFSAECDAAVTVLTNVTSGLGQTLSFRLVPGSPFNWRKPFVAEKDKIPVDQMTYWFVTNVNTTEAKLKVHTLSDIAFPEVRVVPATALALVALVGIYLALRLISPKVSAIALTTAREAMSQPLYYLVLSAGAFSLLAFVVIPYNTFGEDVKMHKDSGLTLIMILSMIVAVWSASVSVSEEVEGRTALTVLSKPVRRRQFILGKFLGVLSPVIVLFIVLGFLFLVTISYKVVYDSREVAKSEPTWQLCYLEMIATVPGLVLAFFETVVMSAISVAISTRLTMLANLIVCASIYVLGHLVPMLVNSSVGKFEIVRFVGQFIATVLPVLDHFNIGAAVAAGAMVPTSYLWMALFYCVLYSSIAMLLGLAMFEDRDLA